jgi:hypothetical protein
MDMPFVSGSLGYPGRAQGTTIDCESIALTQSVEQISSCSWADAARLHSASLPFCSSASLVPRSETRGRCATASTWEQALGRCSRKRPQGP